MKHTNKMKIIAAMAMSVLSFTITGCSSDDFYGFDEQPEDIYELNYILHSREYLDYVSSFNRLSAVIINQSDSVYPGNIIDNAIMQEYKYSYTKLVNIYPEYANLTINKKIELLNHCNTSVYNKVKRTKSGSPEGFQKTTAWKSLNMPRPNGITKVDENNYTCESVTLTIYNNTTTAITNAIVFAMGDPFDPDDNHEFGGYVFDDSSILMCDVYASADSMNLVHWPFGNNVPQFVFHVHPVLTALSDQLDSADDAMKSAINDDGCSGFRIYNLNSAYKDY